MTGLSWVWRGFASSPLACGSFSTYSNASEFPIAHPIWWHGLITGLLSRILVYLVWHWCSPPEIQQWQLCAQKIVCEIWRVIYHFFRYIDTNLGESQWVGRHGSNASRDLQGVETLCCPLAILRGTEPVRALTRALLGSATCAGLAHGRDYSYCILHDSLRTEVPEKASPLFSLELSKILEKQKPTLSDSRFSLLTVTATQNGHIATESLV